jgi:hypothetical protein
MWRPATELESGRGGGEGGGLIGPVQGCGGRQCSEVGVVVVTGGGHVEGSSALVNRAVRGGPMLPGHGGGD